MPSADDFLRAIRADPDADAPRLAYADWLDESGDTARAELIRVQCALAALPAGQREYHPLRERERALLKEHRAAWVRPIRELLQVPERPEGWRHWFRRRGDPPTWQAELRRGFVEVLDLDATAFLRRAEALVGMMPLRKLGLDVRRSTNAAVTLRSVTDCPHLAGLASLSLLTHRLTADEMRRLVASDHLARLRSLRLGCDGFRRSAVEVLAASGLLGRLRTLAVSTSGADDSPWADALLEAPASRGLSSLLVRALGGEADPFHRLSESPPFRRLTELSLINLLIDGRNLEAILSWLPPSLTHLDLWHTGLGDRAVEVLARSPRIRQLRRLGLCRNGISDAGALALADSPLLLASTQLDLSDNPISERVQNALRIRLGHQIILQGV